MHQQSCTHDKANKLDVWFDLKPTSESIYNTVIDRL